MEIEGREGFGGPVGSVLIWPKEHEAFELKTYFRGLGRSVGGPGKVKKRVHTTRLCMQCMQCILADTEEKQIATGLDK